MKECTYGDCKSSSQQQYFFRKTGLLRITQLILLKLIEYFRIEYLELHGVMYTLQM